MVTYAISAAAKNAEATVHQVRNYVVAGLVRPCATTAGGHFLFDSDGVARLRLIAAATRAGFRVAEIGTLINALTSNNGAAVSAAGRDIVRAIDGRQAILHQLQELVAGACGTPVDPEAPLSATRYATSSKRV